MTEQTYTIYLPQDRRVALASGATLPARATGAALLADISGFTPLTEALTLALGPRQGIEELTAQINRVYDALIDQVERFGGSVVGFAGDAITCWFDDGGRELGVGSWNDTPAPADPNPQSPSPNSQPPSPAALRAVACALSMQRAMGPFSALQLPGGGLTAVALKVAVAAGPARRFSVGDPDIQLIDTLVGATVARTAIGEHLAEKGEVLVDANTATILGEQLRISEWRADESGAQYGVVGSLLAAAPEAPWRPAALTAEQARPWLLPPVHERLRDGLGEFLTELRPVVALFLRFGGLDYDGDPEVGLRLDEFIRRVQHVLVRYGGTLLQLTIGDKGSYLYAAFGAPIGHEDDARRSVSAALELRALPGELDSPLTVQIGISQGVIRSGAYGGATRRTYGVLGDEVNLAARLMQHASLGEVLLSGRVIERIGVAFNYESLPPVQLKGKRELVPLARLIGPRAALAVGAQRGALIGRAAELRRLRRLLRPLAAGRSAGLICVYGEAGMGKSRLIAELRRPPQRARRGRAELAWIDLPADEVLRQSLNPFRSLLRERLGAGADADRAAFDAAIDELRAAVNGDPRGAALAAELDRTRSFLAALIDIRSAGSLYERLGPKLRYENTLAGLKALLLAESLRRPLVLHVEDAQWLDEDSLAALRELTRNTADYPIAVLLTSRYNDDGSPIAWPVDPAVPQAIVDLRALDADGVRAIAAQVFGGPVGDDLTNFLTAKTGGNPFFAEQLALDLRERGVLDPATALQAATLAEVPDTLTAVLIARLDRLTARVRAVVQTAAVLGQEFELRLLAGMLRGDAAMLDEVHQAEREAIWLALSELRYLFRHALLRDAAYAMQLRARLRELHRLAATVIELIHPAELAAHAADLAYHYGRAEDTAQERRYAQLAGEQAAARYANADAAAFFGRALDLTPVADGPGRYTLLLAREQIYDLQGARETQRADLGALAELAALLDDPARRAEVALRQARHADVTGDYAAMVAAAQRAIDLAARDQAGQAAGHLHWARALWYQGDYAGVQAQASRALELARAAGSQRLEADSLRILGNAAMYQGNYAEARTAYESAIQIQQALGDRQGESSTRSNLGIIAWYQGDYTVARELYGYDLQVKREIGDRYGQSLALLNLGEVAVVQGDYLGAQSYYAEALRLKRETGDRYGESVVLTSLGDVVTILGDWEQARASYDQALEITRALGHRQQQGWALARLGLLLHQQGQPDEALAQAEQAQALARAINDRNTLAYALTLAGHALAALVRPPEAEAAYREAIELRAALAQPNLAAEAQAGLARLALDGGDLNAALALAESILAQLDGRELEGADEPFGVYLSCYQALRAAADARAGDTLAVAYTRLQERAARISDAGARQVFLARVPSHRALAEAWQAAQP
jgi:class 3 adenylate cyclase/tetratricopeptide (TPR) repeat protein